MTDHRTRIDDAIDRAVRDMLRRDPPAGFRRRVLSRLERASARSEAVAQERRTFLWPVVAAAGAALVIVAIASVFVRDAPPGPRRSAAQVAARVPDDRPASPPARVSEPRNDAGATRSVRRRTRPEEPVRTATFGPRDGRVSATTVRGAPAATAAAALEAASDEAIPATSAPIAVTTPAVLPPIEITPIVVPPIQIAPMRLPPLSPPR